jgi:hypothetical protein
LLNVSEGTEFVMAPNIGRSEYVCSYSIPR